MKCHVAMRSRCVIIDFNLDEVNVGCVVGGIFIETSFILIKFHVLLHKIKQAQELLLINLCVEQTSV